MAGGNKKKKDEIKKKKSNAKNQIKPSNEQGKKNDDESLIRKKQNELKMASANNQITCYNCEKVFDSMNPTEFRSCKYCNSWFCSVCQHSEDDEDTFICKFC